MLGRLKQYTAILIALIIFAGSIIYLFWQLSEKRTVPAARIQPAKIYYADNISTAHQMVIDEFNRVYKGKIEVIPIHLPFSKFSTNERKGLLARALRSNEGELDVFAVDLIWVPRFARWAEPLVPHLHQNLENDFIPEALKSCYFDGKLVALPLYLDTGLLYYRKDLLQQYFSDMPSLENRIRNSISWDELLALSHRLKSEKQAFFLYSAKNFEGLVCSYLETLLNLDPEYFAHGEITFNTETARKALQFLVDIVRKWRIAPPLITEYDEYRTSIYALQNKGFFWRGWPGLKTQYRSTPGFAGKLHNVGVAALPHFKKNNPVSVFGGWNLMISKRSKFKAEARMFIDFFLKRENQIVMFENGGYLPTIKALYADSIFVASHPQIPFYQKLFSMGIHRPYQINYTQMSDVLAYYIHLAIKGELSVDDALQKATAAINSDKVFVR